VMALVGIDVTKSCLALAYWSLQQYNELQLLRRTARIFQIMDGGGAVDTNVEFISVIWTALVPQIVFWKFPLILIVAVLLFEPGVVPFGNLDLFCLSINITALNQLPGNVRTSTHLFLRDGKKQMVKGIMFIAWIFFKLLLKFMTCYFLGGAHSRLWDGRTAPLTYRCCIFYLFNRYTYWIF
jgi:hypothetical protein